MSEDTKEIARKMAQFSISTNQINEVQRKNLGMYPFIFFDGVKGATLDFDLTTMNRVSVDSNPKDFEVKYNFHKPVTDHLFISYDLEIDDSKVDHLERRCGDLKNAVHNLFWKGIRVIVLFNGKKVYEGK